IVGQPENAVPGVKHRLAAYLVSESRAGSELLPIGLNAAPVGVVCGIHQVDISGNRDSGCGENAVRLRRSEERNAIEALRPRSGVLPPQTEIQGELRGDMPIIVRKQGRIELLCRN